MTRASVAGVRSESKSAKPMSPHVFYYAAHRAEALLTWRDGYESDDTFKSYAERFRDAALNDLDQWIEARETWPGSNTPISSMGFHGRSAAEVLFKILSRLCFVTALVLKEATDTPNIPAADLYRQLVASFAYSKDWEELLYQSPDIPTDGLRIANEIAKLRIMVEIESEPVAASSNKADPPQYSGNQIANNAASKPASMGSRPSKLTPQDRRILQAMMAKDRVTFNELREVFDRDISEDGIEKALKRLRKRLDKAIWQFEISMANYEINWIKKGQAVP